MSYYAELIAKLRARSSGEDQLIEQAAQAVESLTAPGRDDLSNLFAKQTATRAERNAYEAASARLTLAQMRERMAELLSQAEPLNGLEVDREKVRQVLRYVECGRLQ